MERGCLMTALEEWIKSVCRQLLEVVSLPLDHLYDGQLVLHSLIFFGGGGTMESIHETSYILLLVAYVLFSKLLHKPFHLPEELRCALSLVQ